MDLLSEEEKQLIKFFEKKVQSESLNYQSSHRQHQGQNNNEQISRDFEDRNQNSFQRYSQMFGSDVNQEFDYNPKYANQFTNSYENQENVEKQDQRLQKYFQQPQKSLNPVIFNGDDKSSNYADNNSHNSKTNSSFNSYQQNKQQNQSDKQVPQSKPSLAQKYQKQHQNDQVLYSYDIQSNINQQNNSKNILEENKFSQRDLNSFTFKPPTSMQQKETQRKNKQESIAKNEEKKIKNTSKKDLSVKKSKQGDQQGCLKKNHNNSDIKQGQKINTTRPQSSRIQQKSIKNNSFVYQSENQNSSNRIINKTPLQMYKNKSQISSQEYSSKIKAQKDEIQIQNNSSMNKQSSNKKSDSKLKKARSTSLFVSNKINQNNFIKKDSSKDKLESVRKRSNSKSKRSYSITNTQSNKQLKSEKVGASSSSFMKGISCTNDINQKELTQLSTYEVFSQFLNVLEQNQEERESIMIKVIENHIIDCKEFKQKILNIVKEQANYNTFKSKNSYSVRGNVQI